MVLMFQVGLRTSLSYSDHTVAYLFEINKKSSPRGCVLKLHGSNLNIGVVVRVITTGVGSFDPFGSWNRHQRAYPFAAFFPATHLAQYQFY